MSFNALDIINSLNIVLTKKQLIRFLKKTKPEFKKYYSELVSSLDNKNWSEAVKQAHKLKTTISLFAYSEFVSSLDAVEAGDIVLIDTPDFKECLDQQYRLCLMSIEEASLLL